MGEGRSSSLESRMCTAHLGLCWDGGRHFSPPFLLLGFPLPSRFPCWLGNVPSGELRHKSRWFLISHKRELLRAWELQGSAVSLPDSGIDPDFPAPADHALNMGMWIHRDRGGAAGGCSGLWVKVWERRGFGGFSGLFSAPSPAHHRDEAGSGRGTLGITDHCLRGAGFILGFV